jgi:methylenetetrahydrofolate reductase (NADH)
MEDTHHDNLLRRRLERRQFVASIEFVTPEAHDAFESAIAPITDLAEHIKADGRFDTIALTDRVKSDHDHDPVRVAARVAEASGKVPIVHLSGKDRDAVWVADAVGRMRDNGLDNVLLVTGDKVRTAPVGRTVRYYDSVNMVAQVRAASPAMFVAAAVSPFKYREEESMNQYLKMVKKERAGANAFITQVGWDMLKCKELITYRRRRGLTAPVMAGVMLLTVARARYIRANKLAGITITDELQARLEAESAQPDKGVGAAYRRLALQIVGFKRLGFAGFQLTGMHQFDKLDRLMQQVDGLERGLANEGAWWDAWWHALRSANGAPTVTAPRSYYLFHELAEPAGWNVPYEALTLRDLDVAHEPSAGLKTFRRLDRLDRLVFADGSPGAAVLKPIARMVPAASTIDRGLHWLEQRMKQPLVGCQTCGFCRLPHTAYVCPETCPKGLANGPCGGTTENLCEFGDRECIHNQKYRIARDAGRLGELEDILIPSVDAAKRGTCSWTNHFRGEDPVVIRLRDIRPKGSGA